MSTPVLNNGLFFRDNTYQLSSNLDSYHIKNLTGGGKPTDLGVIDIWALKKKAQMPLYSLANFKKDNVTVVTGEKFSWKVPVANELPRIVRDLNPTNVRKGIDGQEFEIVLDKRAFGMGSIISYDQYSGVQLLVSRRVPPKQMGKDEYIYTVQVVDGKDKFLGNEFLKPGTSFFRIGSAIGEYGENYDDIVVNAGYREFFQYMPTGKAHVHFSVTREALDEASIIDESGRLKVSEIWKIDESLTAADPSLATATSIESVYKIKGKDWWESNVKSGAISKTFMTRMEAAHVEKIASDIERYLMWGNGGLMENDGADRIRMAPGLWRQLDTAFLHVYNKRSFSLSMFRTQIYNFYNGKVDFSSARPRRKLKVQTGLAGAYMFNEEMIREKIAPMYGNFTINVDQSGMNAIYGNDSMSLGFGMHFDKYIIPFLAEIEIEVNPAFDNPEANEIVNPMIDGYRLSSYSFIIIDITEGEPDNIKLLKSFNDRGLEWGYEVGTMDYLGNTKGIAQTGRFAGCRVNMWQRYPAIFVKDPTKVFKMVMKNPITGGHL